MQVVLHGAQLEAHPKDIDLQRLREELKLDPALMRQLDAEYGPFDWRLPETHAIYWAWRGRQATPDMAGTPGMPGTPGARAFSAYRACDQMMLQCLSAAFRQGRLDFDPATDRYVTTPNLDLLPQAMKIYEEAIARYDAHLFREIYANFLGEAIIILHSYGRLSQAREIYQQTLRRYPIADRTISYDDFISANFAWMQKNAGDLSPPDAAAVVEGFLFQACRQKAAGDSARAAEYERQARAFWNTYMQARASEDHRLRTGLPELGILRQQAERRAQEEAQTDTRRQTPDDR
jgi:tetratricopeptide (TPR) repeat protein